MAKLASRFSLVLFILLTVGGGLLIGALNIPGAWYAALEKPPFNPPSWVFGPVWTALYVLIGIVGWRIWRRDSGGWAMRLWWAQLVLNFAWSPVFFTLHQVGAALAIVLALLATVVAFIGLAWRLDRTAAWLFIPYAAWVAFASLLNGSIFILN
jgi:tryptophan-rich sensory protein